MKNLGLLAFSFLLFTSTAKPCDLTELEGNAGLNGLVNNGGGSYTIDFFLKVGTGITGVNKGASGHTKDFALAVFGPSGLVINSITNVTPLNTNIASNQIADPSTYASYTTVATATIDTIPNSTCTPPNWATYAVNNNGVTETFNPASVIYVDSESSSSNADHLFCISSPGNCGLMRQEVRHLIISITSPNGDPIALEAWGLEGNVNFSSFGSTCIDSLFRGFSCNNTQLENDYGVGGIRLDFDTPLSVTWTSQLTAQQEGEDIVSLKWSAETAASTIESFKIERAETISNNAPRIIFKEIDSLSSFPITSQYRFFDNNPLQGPNLYRISAMGTDGNLLSVSNIALAYFMPESALDFAAPTQSGEIKYFVPEEGSYKLIVTDMSGRWILEENLIATQKGENTHYLSGGSSLEGSTFYSFELISHALGKKKSKKISLMWQ